MPRRGENIYKRKDGRWEGRYVKERIQGKIKYGYIFAKTYREVKDKLLVSKNPESVVVEEQSSNQLPVQDILFSDVARDWFASRKSSWKHSSVVKYGNIVELYLLPEFSNRVIMEITRDEVIQFGGKLLSEGGRSGKGLSPKTVAGIISVLKNVLEYASLTPGITVANLKDVSIRQPQKQMRILSRTEQQRLSDYLRGNLNPCNLGILVCLYTGLRIGEICAMKWEDVSFAEQYLYVHQTMQRLQIKDGKRDGEAKTSVVISTPKSDCSVRKVPIPEEIFVLLKESRQVGNKFFLTGMEHVYMEPRTMQNRFKAVVNKCHIDDVNFHALRHTFATRCVELGFDMKSLSEILGHATVNITLNRYVHPSMELKQKNMNMLSQLFAVK